VPFTSSWGRSERPTGVPGSPGIATLTQERIEKLKREPIPRAVYLRGHWFIVSDDYPTLFAYLKSEWTYVSAIVLGTPEGEGVEIIRGPLRARAAEEAVFGGGPLRSARRASRRPRIARDTRVPRFCPQTIP
jgi:hypothetical protein